MDGKEFKFKERKGSPTARQENGNSKIEGQHLSRRSEKEGGGSINIDPDSW